MKAPDKIFVSTDPFGFMHAYDIENHPPIGEEYLRKDVLLEWAKEEMLSHKRIASKIAANSLSNPLLDIHYASEEACRLLINKLNSM